MGFLLRRLPTPDTIRKTWIYPWFGQRLMDPSLWVPTPHSLALGIALGWFIGLLPFFGFHIPLVLLLGYFLRCHLPAAALGTFITNPLTVPAILVLQYLVGSRICRLCSINPVFASLDATFIVQHGLALLLGGALSAIVAALGGYVWIRFLLEWREKSLVNGVV